MLVLRAAADTARGLVGLAGTLSTGVGVTVAEPKNGVAFLAAALYMDLGLHIKVVSVRQDAPTALRASLMMQP